jgi:hypothetical protein
VIASTASALVAGATSISKEHGLKCKKGRASPTFRIPFPACHYIRGQTNGIGTSQSGGLATRGYEIMLGGNG